MHELDSFVHRTPHVLCSAGACATIIMQSAVNLDVCVAVVTNILPVQAVYVWNTSAARMRIYCTC